MVCSLLISAYSELKRSENIALVPGYVLPMKQKHTYVQASMRSPRSSHGQICRRGERALDPQTLQSNFIGLHRPRFCTSRLNPRCDSRHLRFGNANWATFETRRLEGKSIGISLTDVEVRFDGSGLRLLKLPRWWWRLRGIQLVLS
jgi:hypothetical protein